MHRTMLWISADDDTAIIPSMFLVFVLCIVIYISREQIRTLLNTKRSVFTYFYSLVDFILQAIFAAVIQLEGLLLATQVANMFSTDEVSPIWTIMATFVALAFLWAVGLVTNIVRLPEPKKE